MKTLPNLRVVFTLVRFTQFARLFNDILNIVASLKYNNLPRKTDQCERFLN